VRPRRKNYSFFSGEVPGGRVDAFAILKEPTAFEIKPKPQKPVEEAAIAELAEGKFPEPPGTEGRCAAEAKATSFRHGARTVTSVLG
jgi:hypothetical protein